MVMQSPLSTSGNSWSSLYTLCEVAASKSTSQRDIASFKSSKTNNEASTSDDDIQGNIVKSENESGTDPSEEGPKISMDESMVAAALLELSASTVRDPVDDVNSNKQLKLLIPSIDQRACDMKPVDLSNSSGKTLATDHVGKQQQQQQQVHLLLPQSKVNDKTTHALTGQRSNLAMIHCIALKNNENGAKLIQLPKGFEYLLQPKTPSNSTPQNSKPMISSANRPNALSPNISLVTGIISKSLVASNNNSNNNNNGNNNAVATAYDSNNNTNGNNNSHRSGKASSREITPSNNVLHLQPNVYHFFSPSSSANQQNNSASANFASAIGFKKRGRKRLYEGADGTSSTTNPIKEFRLRQRRREHEENILLNELEDKYRNSPEYTMKLEQLYDANSLNIHFPRIKTNLKRGKAKDDVERINRKKLCARRDSKNYRERAKMKRELITKKIQLLENILNNSGNSATIQVIHPSSYMNGCSNSSTCSSSTSASPSPQIIPSLPVTSTSSSSSSSSPDLLSASSCMPNLFLFKRP